MKLSTFALTFILIAAPLLADYQHFDFDDQTDFSKLKTFSLRDGKINTSAPELNSALSRQKIADELRAGFTAKGLSEVKDGADIVVNYELGTITGRGVNPNGRPQPFQYVEANLIIELLRKDSQPIWRGIYRDDETEPGKFAKNLSRDIKRLLSKFPPKK